MIKRCLALFLMLMGSVSAFAQGGILQAGPVVPGHAPQFIQNGAVSDSGPASGGGPGSGLSELNITARGTGTAPYAGQGSGPLGTTQCNYDGPITSPGGFHYLCMSANAQGGGLLTYGSGGGAAALPFECNINGVVTPCLGSPGAGTMQTVPSIASLRALAGGAGQQAQVAGYYNAGDGGGGLFWWNSADSSSDNGFTVIQASSVVGPGRWDRVFQGNTVSLLASGAVPGGATDVTSTLISMASTLTALAVPNGWHIEVPPMNFLIGTSANLDLSSYRGIVIEGETAAVGYNSGASYPYNFTLNPAHSILPGNQMGFRGIRITRLGATIPTTLRQAITEVESFSGTAFTVSNVKDVTFDHVQTDGFAHATVETNSDRIDSYYMVGDVLNGRSVTGCEDTCHSDHDEWWPFEMPYINPQVSNVSNVTASGGLIEVTLSVAPATTLVTGDTVVVGSVGGVTAANGRWIITAIDSTHFTLNGSTFSGTYTSGGTVILNPFLRAGTALLVSGSAFLAADHLTEFGHDIGYYVTAGSTGGGCDNCWLDGQLANNPDPTPVGVKVDGVSNYITISNAFVSSKANSVYINNSTGSVVSILGSTLGNTGINNGSGIYISGGALAVSASHITGSSNPSSSGIYIADGASFLNMSQTDLSSSITYQTLATDCPKFINNNQVYCIWTPALAGSTAAGTATYGAAQTGYYIRDTNHVLIYFFLNVTGFTGATGNLEITGLPVSPSSTKILNNVCTFSDVSDLGLDSGFTQFAGWVVPGGTAVMMRELGAGTGSGYIGVSKAATFPLVITGQCDLIQ